MSRDRVASEMEASKQEMQLLELSSQERTALGERGKAAQLPRTPVGAYNPAGIPRVDGDGADSAKPLFSRRADVAAKATSRQFHAPQEHALWLSSTALASTPTSDSHTPGQSGSSSHRNSDEEEDEEEDSYEAELPLPRRRPACRKCSACVMRIGTYPSKFELVHFYQPLPSCQPFHSALSSLSLRQLRPLHPLSHFTSVSCSSYLQSVVSASSLRQLRPLHTLLPSTTHHSCSPSCQRFPCVNSIHSTPYFRLLLFILAVAVKPLC